MRSYLITAMRRKKEEKENGARMKKELYSEWSI